MLLLFIVGLGGFIGTCLRYIVSLLCTHYFKTQLPLATFIVNIIGCIIIGFVMISCTKLNISPATKLFLTTGMMGGLTTFSTFSYETVMFINNQQYFLACLNVLANVVLGIIGVWIGMSLSNVLH